MKRLAIMTLAILLWANVLAAGEVFDQATLDFARQVRLDGWQRMPVQVPGRIAIFDTVARQHVSGLYGDCRIEGTSPEFSFMELYFNAGAYLNKPLVAVDDSRLRRMLAATMDSPTRQQFERTGRLPPLGLIQFNEVIFLAKTGRAVREQVAAPQVGGLFQSLGAMASQEKLARPVQSVRARAESFIQPAWRIVPLDPEHEGYIPPEGFFAAADANAQKALGPEISKWMNDQLGNFMLLGQAWRSRNAGEVNRLLEQMRQDFAARSGKGTLPAWRAGLELQYNRFKGYWLAMALLAASLASGALGGRRPGADRMSIIETLIALWMAPAVYVLDRWIIRDRWRRPGADRMSTIALVAAGAVLVASAVERWIISNRGWSLPPLTNQYETLLAAVLFAVLLGLALGAVLRSRVLPMAAAGFAMAALAVLMVQPGPVKADITAPGQILVSPVLGYHVATLMLGYSAIAMSLIVSLAYLVYSGRQFLARPDRFRRLENLLPIPARSTAAAESTEQLAEATLENTPEADGPAMAEDSAQASAVAEQPVQAASLDWPDRLDQANLALIQIATFLVAVGVVLGAYWADLSWGRWWGWDSKETWALMTLLVYVAIIHLRQVAAPSARALWTAALSVVGCLVMLFTWWGVNYLMGGLHSYA